MKRLVVAPGDNSGLERFSLVSTLIPRCLTLRSFLLLNIACLTAYPDVVAVAVTVVAAFFVKVLLNCLVRWRAISTHTKFDELFLDG